MACIATNDFFQVNSIKNTPKPEQSAPFYGTLVEAALCAFLFKRKEK